MCHSVFWGTLVSGVVVYYPSTLFWNCLFKSHVMYLCNSSLIRKSVGLTLSQSFSIQNWRKVIICHYLLSIQTSFDNTIAISKTGNVAILALCDGSSTKFVTVNDKYVFLSVHLFPQHLLFQILLGPNAAVSGQNPSGMMGMMPPALPPTPPPQTSQADRKCDTNLFH